MFTIEMVPIRYSIGLMVKNKYRMIILIYMKKNNKIL